MANDYETGQSIGRAIGGLLGGTPGNDIKDFSKDKQYKFDKIKNICTITIVPQNYSRNVVNVNMVGNYDGVLAKTFPVETFRPKVTVGSKLMRAFFDDPATKFISEQDRFAAFKKYIATNYDAILYINIYAYNRGMNNTGNCALDFKLVDLKSGKDILYYKDFRLNAPRSWPEGMIQRITDTFKGKLEDAIEDSKNSK